MIFKISPQNIRISPYDKNRNKIVVLCICKVNKHEREDIIMKKVTRKNLSTVIEKIAFKIAAEDANSACPCISYQPKLPKSVKKLRKF